MTNSSSSSVSENEYVNPYLHDEYDTTTYTDPRWYRPRTLASEVYGETEAVPRVDEILRDKTKFPRVLSDIIPEKYEYWNVKLFWIGVNYCVPLLVAYFLLKYHERDAKLTFSREESFSKIDENIWVTEEPFKYATVEMGNRMTIVRLRDGSLMLYSPITPSPLVISRIQHLGGHVRYIILASPLYHYAMDEMLKLFPDAEVWGSEESAAARPDLPVHILDEEYSSDIDEQFEYSIMPGYTGEVVMLHRESETLLTCDLCSNIPAEVWNDSLITGMFYFFTRSLDRVTPPVSLRFRLLLNPFKWSSFLREIVTWEFRNIVMSHGIVVRGDGRATLRRAFGNRIGGVEYIEKDDSKDLLHFDNYKRMLMMRGEYAPKENELDSMLSKRVPLEDGYQSLLK